MEYGKFKTADDLYKGYVELEKTFTQKCQQLSMLEKEKLSGTSENTPPQNNAFESTAETATVPEEANSSRQSESVITPEQIEQYLDAHKDYAVKLLDSARRQTARTDNPEDKPNEQNDQSGQEQPIAPPLICGGGNLSMALPNRPKTLKEASELAKKLFN